MSHLPSTDPLATDWTSIAYQLCHARDLAQASNLLLASLQQVRPLDRAGVALLSHRQTRLYILSSHPHPPPGHPAEFRISKQSLARLEAAPLAARDIFTPADFDHLPASITPQTTIFSLISRGDIVGIVWAGLAEGELEARAQASIQHLCDITAATLAHLGIRDHLVNKQKEHQLQLLRRQQVSEGFRYILTILNSDRPLSEVLRYIISQACWLFDTTMGAAFRWHAETTSLQIIVQHGIPVQRLQSLDTHPLYNAIYHRQATVSTSAPPAAAQKISSSEFATSLTTPILINDEPYGCIALYFAEERSFSQEEINLALTFSEQAALAIENARLRAEAEKQAVDSERQRLARDLHDAITQNLFASNLIAEALPQLWEQDRVAAQAKLQELKQLNQSALSEMRSLLLELRPESFAEMELGDLIQQLQSIFASRMQIPVRFQQQHNPVVPAPVKVQIYRIAQEALNNIAKHAQATAIHIALLPPSPPARQGFVLHIQDDGIGFDQQHIPSQCMGINIMKERAQAVHAELRIETASGRGTTIQCLWAPPPITL